MAEAAQVIDIRPETATVSPTVTAEPAQSQPPSDMWAANWRETWAGQDDKRAEFVKRLPDPRSVLDKAYEANLTIAKGLHKKGLDAKATPDQVIEYRKANGIPEKAEAYLEKLPDGLVIGENDKPVIGSFAEAAHALHLPPAQVHELVKWYYSEQDKASGAMAEHDKKAGAERERALKGEWGPEYQANVNTLKEFMVSAPPEIDEMIGTARGGDGTRLLDSPIFTRWLAGIALEHSPVNPIVGGGDGSGVSRDTRKAEIKALMGNRASEYWKGPKSEALHKEYMAIIEAEKKVAKR